MTGASFSASLRAAPVLAAMRRLEALGAHPGSFLAPIGAGLVELTLQRFERGRDPEGRPWAPWLPAYAAITRSNGILRGRGTSGGLMGSISFRVEGAGVRVGSNKKYAAVHQFGATIRPVNAPALAFFLGSVRLGPRGGVHRDRHLVLAKKVVVPARPYLGFGPAERAMVLEQVQLAVERAIAAAGRAG